MPKCLGCGARTRAMNLCRSCKAGNKRLHKAAKANGWLVDWAGGAVWVWDARGEILAGPCKSHLEALREAFQ